MYTFWYINRPNVTADERRFSDSIAYSGNFDILLHVRHLITSSNFYKLCVTAEVFEGPMILLLSVTPRGLRYG